MLARISTPYEDRIFFEDLLFDVGVVNASSVKPNSAAALVQNAAQHCVAARTSAVFVVHLALAQLDA